MGLALEEAAAAVAHGDVPVGAVVLRDGEVIAQRHNEREHAGDPTAHAEVLALRDAADIVGSWRLDGLTLVVTLEPCTMCAGALVHARIGRLIFGTREPRAGAVASTAQVLSAPHLNHRVEVIEGVFGDEAQQLMQEFFRAKRQV